MADPTDAPTVKESPGGDGLSPRPDDKSVARKAIEQLPWRWALPADAMPAHQYVLLRRCPTDAWDRLARVIRDHPASFAAYFRGYPRPNRYWEFEGWRYWRTSAAGPTHMLNRCALDSVEPPRRVDAGVGPLAWVGPPWAPYGTPWPPGYVPGDGPAYMAGMVYRAESDPRAGFPCRRCGRTYWLYESSRPCPACGELPALDDDAFDAGSIIEVAQPSGKQ